MQRRTIRQAASRRVVNRRVRLLEKLLVTSLIVLIMITGIVMICGGRSQAMSAGLKPSNFRLSSASCFGPGLYGNTTANGTRLTRRTIGVAHRSLRFGTKIEFRTHNRRVVARVIDRGPFIRGRTFDLTHATVRRLGVSSCYSWGVRTVKWRVVR